MLIADEVQLAHPSFPFAACFNPLTPLQARCKHSVGITNIMSVDDDYQGLEPIAIVGMGELGLDEIGRSFADR